MRNNKLDSVSYIKLLNDSSETCYCHKQQQLRQLRVKAATRIFHFIVHTKIYWTDPVANYRIRFRPPWTDDKEASYFCYCVCSDNNASDRRGVAVAVSTDAYPLVGWHWHSTASYEHCASSSRRDRQGRELI